jgi:16S rRNA (guanine966-N2)-methyltransferase
LSHPIGTEDGAAPVGAQRPFYILACSEPVERAPRFYILSQRRSRGMTMRITGGTARGIPLRVPPGDAVRPATDGMRQAVFSSLAARLPSVRFFDLFAGSGAYGLEALSRGAAGGVFVERNAKAAACVRQNLAAVCKSLGSQPAAAAKIYTLDVFSAPLSACPPPELVFIDPPYEIIEEIGPRLFTLLDGLLAPVSDPIIVFEMPGELTLEPPGWSCVKRLGKGTRQPTACFFRRAP